MLRYVLWLAVCPAFFAQQPADLFEKATPDVEQALRGRVTKFFQAYVDGKFRLADTLVAEDSKDVFFAAEKNKYYGFDIIKITYSENFTRAIAVVACDTDFVAGFQRLKVKMPVTSFWRLENGEWWWYAPPRPQQVDTPFGLMSPGTDANNAPVIPDVKKLGEELANQVKVERREIHLSSFQPASDRITISNQMQGSIELSLDYARPPGFEAKIEKPELKAGETGGIEFKYKPRDKAPKETLTINLKVSPTGQVIPLRVLFAVPEGTLPRMR